MFVRTLLFPASSKPMNVELTELRTAWPIMYTDAIRMRGPMEGRFRMFVAITLGKRSKKREMIRVKVSLKRIPTLIKLAAFLSFPTEWNRAENLVRAGETPKSLRVTRKVGTIRMILYRP